VGCDLREAAWPRGAIPRAGYAVARARPLAQQVPDPLGQREQPDLDPAAAKLDPLDAASAQDGIDRGELRRGEPSQPAFRCRPDRDLDRHPTSAPGLRIGDPATEDATRELTPRWPAGRIDPAGAQEPCDVMVRREPVLRGYLAAGQAGPPVGDHQLGRLDLDQALASRAGLDAGAAQELADVAFAHAVAAGDLEEGRAGLIGPAGCGELVGRERTAGRHGREIARLSGRVHVAIMLQ
jgi:hypothetical protein